MLKANLLLVCFSSISKISRTREGRSPEPEAENENSVEAAAGREAEGDLERVQVEGLVCCI